jgi:hypothetical protein
MDALHVERRRAHEGWLATLNGRGHEAALLVYLAIVLAHWAEHLFQAVQVYMLGWPLPEARGFLGYYYPWLVQSESMHYAYALTMLVGLWILRRGFTGVSRRWWTAAFAIQFFHHFEHLLLFIQAQTGHYLAGRPVPTSLLQLWVPRVELHLFYNTIVFIPMVVAMYYHMFPTPDEAATQSCTCAWKAAPAAGRASAVA